MPHDNTAPELTAQRIRHVIGLLTILLLAAGISIYRGIVLNDPDTFWHIRTGSDIWNSGHFPVQDSYSYTFKGHPWIAKEWLSQMFLALSYEVAGWNGVVFLASLNILAFGGVIYFLLARHLRPLVAAAIAIPAFFLSSPVFVARPHIFTLALTLIWGYYLFEAARQHRAPHFGLLAVLALWTNLHGGFTIGFLIAGFAFLDFAERSKLSDRRATLVWIGFLILCPAVTLLNPYGYQAALLTFQMAGGNEAVPFIAEWLPFNPRTNFIHHYGLLLILGLLLASGARFTLSRSIFVTFLLFMFFSHVRFCYLAFALLPVVLAPDVAVQFPRLSATIWKTQARDPVEQAASDWYRTLTTATSLALALIMLSILALLPIRPDPKIAADGALAFAAEHRLTGHVMNGYDFGGTLVLRGIPTYLDGRTDQLFLDGFVTADRKMQEPGGDKLFHQALLTYDVAWTLFQPSDPRVIYLDSMPGWERAYADPTAIIHIRKTSTAP